MSSIEPDKIILTVSVANSKFEIDSEYTKVSDFFTTWLEGASRVEGHPEIVSENSNVSIDVLKGMTMPEVVIENIIKYMNITKGIRQDILPHPLKEILPGEKGMRAYLCKVRETPSPKKDEEEPGAPKKDEEEPAKKEEPYNFELADFIDNYVEKNGMTGLYEMIGYSNYLGIKSLMYLCCGKVALMMKDKTLEEIKTLVESGVSN